MFASPDWKPCRKIAFPDWKIKHVNYFSVKPGTIRLIREKRSSLTCAVVEDYSVKNRIDNISESSCQNKRNSYNQVSGTVFLTESQSHQPIPVTATSLKSVRISFP